MTFKIKHDLSFLEENLAACPRLPAIPVVWSTRTRELMMRPNRENMSSTSFWVMVLGSPLMYKLASLMTSELGRAYDTFKTKPLSRVRAGVWPKHQVRVSHLG